MSRAAPTLDPRSHAQQENGGAPVTFPDLSAELQAKLPELRGRLGSGQKLADITWFRVGGAAQALFSPADEADLAYFLANIPADLPVTVIGLGSNLLVRDGGVEGVVIRLGRGFAGIAVEEGHRLRVGTVVPDVKVARAAADAGIAGLASGTRSSAIWQIGQRPGLSLTTSGCIGHQYLPSRPVDSGVPAQVNLTRIVAEAYIAGLSLRSWLGRFTRTFTVRVLSSRNGSMNVTVPRNASPGKASSVTSTAWP